METDIKITTCCPSLFTPFTMFRFCYFIENGVRNRKKFNGCILSICFEITLTSRIEVSSSLLQLLVVHLSCAVQKYVRNANKSSRLLNNINHLERPQQSCEQKLAFHRRP